MAYNISKNEIEKRKYVDMSNEMFFAGYARTNLVEENKYNISFIENLLLESEYPLPLKPYVKKLCSSVDVKNLYNLAINLSSVKVKRINPFTWLLLNKSYGTYDSRNNIISYFDKSSIPHELLHLASTSNSSYSGFNVIKYRYNFANGFNEGYTEMLSQRIFFNSIFTKSAYKTDVYLMRIFELLYDDPKELERAYFNADFENPIEKFLKFGSLNEYKYFMKNLDYFATTDIWDDEETVVFEFLINLIKRAGFDDKTELARSMYEEYMLTEKVKVK